MTSFLQSGRQMVPAPTQSENFRAGLLMVAAMAGFAVEDLLIKQVAVVLPVGQILLMASVLGTLVFGTLVLLRGQKLWERQFLGRAFVIRNVSDVIGFALGTVGLTLIPLSLTASIMQTAPLLVTMGAALFLGEQVGWRRWLAVGIGLIGVLMILRPGSTAFDPAALFVVAGVVGLAIRDLATRATSMRITTLQMIFWANALANLGALGVVAIDGRPFVAMEFAQIWRIAIAFILGGTSYYGLLIALRLGEASAVVPLRYSRLIFATTLGVTFLGERPEAIVLAGAGLVIGSGLYTFWREAQLGRSARPSPAKVAPL